MAVQNVDIGTAALASPPLLVSCLWAWQENPSAVLVLLQVNIAKRMLRLFFPRNAGFT